MKIDIAKKDLRELRDYLYYSKDIAMYSKDNASFYSPIEQIEKTDKFIRKINGALKEVCGHDYDGKKYLGRLI